MLHLLYCSCLRHRRSRRTSASKQAKQVWSANIKFLQLTVRDYRGQTSMECKHQVFAANCTWLQRTDFYYWQQKCSPGNLICMGIWALYKHIVVITETTDQPKAHTISVVAELLVTILSPRSTAENAGIKSATSPQICCCFTLRNSTVQL